MIPGGRHRPILRLLSGGRRQGKDHALQLAIDSWRDLGIHTHVVEPGRTVCVTGKCPGLPVMTSREERRLSAPGGAVGDWPSPGPTGRPPAAP